jgi:ribosomal protein S18
MLERLQKFVFEATRVTQKDITGVRNINVLIGEN